MKNEPIIGRKDVAKEALSFLFSLLVTTIGFFLALYFNNRIEDTKDLEVFSNAKKSIISEIKENEQIIDSSFYKYIDGVIFNELSTIASNQQLTNNYFLKHTDAKLLILLQNYIHICDLCNKQKNQLKEFRIAGNKDDWADVLQYSLEKNIEKAEKCMEELDMRLNKP